MTRSEPIPRPFAVYSALVALAAIALFAVAWRAVPVTLTPILVFLMVAVFLSENFALDVPGVGSTSLSYPLTIAGVILLGPAAGGAIALCSGVNVRDLRMRRPFPVVAFNIGQLVVSAVLAGLAYVALGGRLLAVGSSASPLLSTDFPFVLLPIAVCTVVSFLANDIQVGIALRLKLGVGLIELWTTRLMWMAPTQIALAAVGVTIAQVLAVQYLAFLLFVFPLLLARQVYQNYVQLKSALADTIQSLINVLEAKDPYTRGHSQRVAEYARMLGEAMQLDPREATQLEYAAILHDIGKLTLPRAILLKPGKLDADEREMINQHPATGASMIERIPHLKGLSAIIAGHHERFDGAGYPVGTMGVDIPRLARMLAVVDSFDAMTTARPYRPPLTLEEALVEIRGCSGTQFDPEVVDVFCSMGVRLIDHAEERSSSSTAIVTPVTVGAES